MYFKLFAEDIYITPNFLSEIENRKKGLSCESQKVSADYLLFGDSNEEEEISQPKLIIETASQMKSEELSVVIEYLSALKKTKEL